MVPPLAAAASAASAACIINTSSLNILNATTKLWSSVKRDSSKATEIRNLSLKQKILPERAPKDGKDKAEALPYIKTPLIEFIQAAYTSKTRGNSHVIYASSSVGKTSACRVIMELEAAGRKIQALMIDSAQKGVPYVSHLAKQLNMENEEDVLVDLVDGMRTVPPTQASILILDEMNDAGVENCNIILVDALMRFIYERRQGIHLIVVTQNQDVADELCRLNKWQKIAPLDGLTDPTTKQVQKREAPMPTKGAEIPWNDKALEWSLENLTKFVDTRFKDHGFEKGGEDDEKKNIITWLELGMTPTDAEKVAENLLEEEEKKKASEAGTVEDHLRELI
jgi:hypothetical protein